HLSNIAKSLYFNRIQYRPYRERYFDKSIGLDIVTDNRVADAVSQTFPPRLGGKWHFLAMRAITWRHAVLVASAKQRRAHCRARPEIPAEDWPAATPAVAGLSGCTASATSSLADTSSSRPRR